MSNENVLTITKDNFDQEVMKSENAVLVDFWAPWCGPCRAVGPVIDELANEFVGKVKIGKLNVDEEGVVAEKYRIMSIPTIIVFKNGEVAEKVIGARPKEELVKILQKYS